MRKFDPARVIQDSELFQEPRPPASPGEARAVERVAAMLRDAGWEVEILDAEQLPEPPGSIVRRAFGTTLADLVLILLLYVWIWYSLSVLFPRSHPGFLITTPAAPALLVGVLRWRRRLHELRTEREFPSRLVLARLPRKGPAERRLVVATQITTGTSHLSIFYIIINCLILLSCMILLMLGLVSASLPVRLFPWLETPWFIGAFLPTLLATHLFHVCYQPRAEAPHRGDERTSLALLAELARTWPRRVELGLETWLVASAWRLQDDLLRGLLSSEPPTLWIRLAAVGVGPKLSISGCGPAVELVWQAAESLRVPFRRQKVECRTRQERAPVWIRGVASDLPFDPSMIAGMSQVVTEAAFRWAKSR
ncbi:MAG: hypothetical protein U0835_25585 [Isosphaeraceae bacterium]